MMKRLIAVATMVGVLMSGMTVLAANPSATGTLPGVSTDKHEGKDVEGVIVDKDGNVIAGIDVSDTSSILVTNSSNASAEVKAKISTATEQLKSVKSITDVVDSSALPSGFNADKAEAVSVFDVDVTDEIKAVLAANPGSSVAVNITASDVPAGAKVVVLHNYEGDKWEVIPSANNGNGTVKIYIGANGFSPVAIYVDTTTADTTAPATTTPATTASSPKTGDYTNIALLLAIAGIALVGAVSLVVARKRG